MFAHLVFVCAIEIEDLIYKCQSGGVLNKMICLIEICKAEWLTQTYLEVYELLRFVLGDN